MPLIPGFPISNLSRLIGISVRRRPRMKRTLLCVGLVAIFLSAGFCKATAEVRYSVKSGDTLSKIAKKFKLNPQDLSAANQLDSKALKRGQILVIPNRNSLKEAKAKQAVRKSDSQEKTPEAETEIYKVKKGDTLKSIAIMVNCSEKQLKKMNRLKSNSLKVGRALIVPKVRDNTTDSDQDLSEDDDAVSENSAESEIKEEQRKQNSCQSIGRWSSPDERNLFIRVVKTFLGVPYRYGGSTLRGIDCSAFVKRVYEIVDISLPRTAREQSQVGKWVKKDELEDGDLVFFRTRRVNDHVGIYIGGNQFVHLSSRNREAKIDNLDEPYFQKRFIRGVRVKELNKKDNSSQQLSLQRGGIQRAALSD